MSAEEISQNQKGTNYSFQANHISMSHNQTYGGYLSDSNCHPENYNRVYYSDYNYPQSNGLMTYATYDQPGPSGTDGNGYVLNETNGAVKKNRQRTNNGRRYGSGRTFSSSNQGRNYYEKPQNYHGKYDENRTETQYDGKPVYYKSKKNYYNNSNTKSYNNQRPNPRNNSRYHSNKFQQRSWRNPPDKAKENNGNRRENLEAMLSNRTLECLVCCESVKHADSIWSCLQCYVIIHLDCVSAWASASTTADKGWRCPACQNINKILPKDYQCFCGRQTNPRIVPGVVPHACGEICRRNRKSCEHRCMILCHPGPCPECDVVVTKTCGCGATKQSVKCGSKTDIICTGTCDKLLNCQVHRCQTKCHPGDCTPCSERLKQECHCGKIGRYTQCTANEKGADSYACGEPCDKLLSCGNHRCQRLCHPGECDGCDRDVNVVRTCPCGRTTLDENSRTSCLDPIPTCDGICDKLLKCGRPNAPHRCQEKCHEGDCAVCPLTTLVGCRCGHMNKEMACADVTTKADDARCEKKCVKKRLCGKHRCNQRCCIEIEHVCPLPCNHLLACGHHRCERTCHSGRCPPCMETSFDELYCECGANVLYPPIACGTRPPPCDQPCSRHRACGHPTDHSCHTGACPPCTVLCKRWCHGRHEERAAIPCHHGEFSCGLPCDRPMPCGQHRCIRSCHLDECPTPCRQPCKTARPTCGHSCDAPCHEGACPSTVCKHLVPVTCECGLQKSSRPCIELADAYKSWEMACIKDKLGVKDQPIDITDIVNAKINRPTILKILECTEECRVLERNRRLAIGLQIRNPDLSQKLTPRYSDFMRNWAKKDPYFCRRIHDKLTELVQLAKQSKQKSRSHSFECMNRDKRQFVHEYCEHFGCESAAYDAEPNRNVVATAIRDKSWLPSMSLLEVIQRESGQRKVPGPMLGSRTTPSKSETVAMKVPTRMPTKTNGRL